MAPHLQPLIHLTRTLGEPERDYVIIGEGNTSFHAEEESFWLKASGQGMHNIGPEGFVEMRFAPLLTALEDKNITVEAMQQVVNTARVDPIASSRPSVEVAFHAILLHECGARYIAHTHPGPVNMILCSSRAEQFAVERVFPDQVVLCGPRSGFVPYADPGLPLALAIRDCARAYIEAEGEPPKTILLQNHGLIALAQTPEEALNITAMAVKAAKIFAGACSVGEPVFMTQHDIYHIYKRPDEIYRRERFVRESTDY